MEVAFKLVYYVAKVISRLAMWAYDDYKKENE